MSKSFVPDRRSRFAGCLLGGAVGDALGYPVEFKTENEIFSKYGPEGIQTLEQAGDPAVITDDTQMTLFTANGLLYGMTRTGASAERKDIWVAMREWLHTQEDGVKGVDPLHPTMWLMEKPQLFAQRAPGITCLKSIRMSMVGGTIDDPINNSKGCGGVMRVAPFGLVSSVLNESGADHATRFAAEAAAQTHGHFLGYLSAAMLARIVWNIVHEPTPGGEHPLAEIVLQAGRDTEKVFPNAWNMVRRAAEVVEMALDETVSDLKGVHESGEGWVGEEALYTAVFCAVRHENDFAAAIRCAVNHKGDSDSTGAVCGNILGAWLGKEAVEAAFNLEHLEMRELIETVADDLYQAAENGLNPGDECWKKRYCRGGVTEIPDRRRAEEQLQAENPGGIAPLNKTGLIYTPLTKKAMEICIKAHRDQKDKSGLPYILHPFHLAERMETEEEVCAALLHDVVEDTPWTLGRLRAEGFPPKVVDAVFLLTHHPSIPYFEYVERIRTNPIARRVKLADLEHNSDLGRLDNPTEKDRERREKYLKAMEILKREI